MPKTRETERDGVDPQRTIRVGKGKTLRILHIAIVRKAGPRASRTAAGKPHKK